MAGGTENVCRPIPLFTRLKLPSMRNSSVPSSEATTSNVTGDGLNMDLRGCAGHLERHRPDGAGNLDRIEATLQLDDRRVTQEFVAYGVEVLVTDRRRPADVPRGGDDLDLCLREFFAAQDPVREGC